MTQPKFAPIAAEDEVRPQYRLEPPRPWVPHRPAETATSRFVPSPRRGTPGPDQGYALKLAERLADRLVLKSGESPDDVLLGGALVALGRAGAIGRAPVLADIELALSFFGYFEEPPAELVALRRGLFGGIVHDYPKQRRLVAAVSPELIGGNTPERWRALLEAPGAAPTEGSA